MCYGIIYKIENKINGKIYIGQTTRTFDERYGGDVEKNTHNKHLKRSIEKHDIENFVIDKCICECDSEEELNEAEKFYIDFFDSANPEHGYNMTLGGEGGTPNDETKQKISKALKGENCYWYGKCFSEEHKQKLSESLKGEKNPMYGKRHSEETKKKMSEAQKGEKNPMYNKHLSEETKKKMSKAKKGEKHPKARTIVQLDKNGNFIRKYDFIKQAEKELNISHIGCCCKGKIKSAGGYIWMYEDEFISRTTGEPVVPDINTHI